MSVTPLPSVPGPSALVSPPALRLLTGHEHAWELRAVEFDDGLEVRRYECCECDDVLFR
jgi:hypothetical protein